MEVNRKYRSYSNILFSKSGFLKGMTRVLDLFGVVDKYNSSSTEKVADSKAIYSDWLTVGNDIRNVLENEQQKIK